MNPTTLSLGAAFLVAALAVLVLLKESRQARVPLALGLLLLALVELFDALALRSPGGFAAYKRVVLLLLALIPQLFLLYGTQFTRKRAGVSRALALAPLFVISLLFCLGALTLPLSQLYEGIDRGTGTMLVLGRIGYWLYLGLMIFCIAALVHLESVFAGIRGADRWRVKFEFLGVGAILATMIFYFSQGLLYKAVNLEMLPVRSGVAVVAALMIGYSRLYRGRTASISVSRQALYRSFTLVAVGLYLLALGLVGEGMRYFRISLTPGLTLFVAVLSGIAFLALLLSDEIRRRLRVLIAKHFYAQKHDYREEWLGFSSALAVCRDIGEVRAAILARYQSIFGVRFALLYVREGAAGSHTLVAARDRETAPGQVALTPACLRYFTETGRVLNPADGEYTPTPEETGFLREAGAWLAVPLLAGERLEAFVVLGGQVVPERLTYEDFDLMKILGRQAVLSLQNFRLTEELSEAREMAAVAKVSSFVIHDLKNLAYTFSLMMENAGEHIAEPEFQRDLVRSIRNTVEKMNGLIAKLKAFPEKAHLRRERVDAALLVREVVDEVRALKKTVSFETDLSEAPAPLDSQEFRKVVLNLLLNACDAVQGQGRIRVVTGVRGGDIFVEVEDDGAGMPTTFLREHLFKPFRTTKEKGLGIGLYQCKQIVEAHGGRIEVASREGEGTVFTVVLPASGDPSAGLLSPTAGTSAASSTASPVSAVSS